MIAPRRVAAHAKVNLCLFVGETREDGRHELVTVFESVELADELVISASPSGADEVVCPAVPGPNLVAEALVGLRAAGWAAPPVRVDIDKRIPVAAGMGGGSADAAALLRAAPDLAPVAPAAVHALAAALGADVPAALDPGAALGTGAGELVRPLPDAAEHAFVVVPADFGLSTAEVYRAFDARDVRRNRTELLAAAVNLETTIDGPGWTLPGALITNELQAAALTLAPEIARPLAAIRAVGAPRALVCGSGPTVIGVFWGPEASGLAGAAAERLAERWPGTVATRPVLRGVPVPVPPR